MREINEIFIHCSATRPEWGRDLSTSWKVTEISKWHTDRGFDSIGYHYIIDRNGIVACGRPEHVVGAHAKGHNTNSIGICLIGGFGSSSTDNFEDHYTEEQRISLYHMLDGLGDKYPEAKIRGHNEVSSKACPGFNVGDFLHEYDTKIEDVETGSSSSDASDSSWTDIAVGFLGKLFSR